jgi:hypothetical protein
MDEVEPHQRAVEIVKRGSLDPTPTAVAIVFVKLHFSLAMDAIPRLGYGCGKAGNFTGIAGGDGHGDVNGMTPTTIICVKPPSDTLK